jgi:predicted amidohydrolase YtcJ
MFESTVCRCALPHSALAGLIAPPRTPHRSESFGRHRVPAGSADRADLLVLGSIVTMDPARPQAEGLAVRGGRVLALGSRDDLEGLRGPDTEILELGDRVALPGLVEPHMHLWSTVVFDRWLDCSPLANPTFGSVVERLRWAAAEAPPGAWVTGKLLDPSLYPGEPELTTAILDEIAPDNPVLVANASQHYLYANTRALGIAHVSAQTPDPPGGRYERADGALTGVVAEMSAMLPVLNALPKLSHDQLLDGLVAIMNRAARVGVTKVHEAATGALFGAGELDILHGLAAAGRLPVRVSAALLDEARAHWEEAGVQPRDGTDLVRATSWKVVFDGSNQGRSGYLRQPYLGSAGRGAANCTVDQLREVIRYAHDRGWQVMVHANGDAAIDQTVAAYEKALADAEPKDLRHRIEHCSIGDGDQFRRMAATGVSPSFLMNHVYYWGKALRDRILGPDRADRLDAVATALVHGLRPSLHSDYSVSPVCPLRSVQTAVTRRMRDGGEVLNPAERIGVEQALRAVTVDAAWQTHADDVLGSLAPGKYADLAILSADPRTADPDSIAEIEVQQTRLAGAVTWAAG